MVSTIISEIILCLLLAAVIGFVVGYWWRKLFGHAAQGEVDRWHQQLAEKDQLLTALRAEADARMQDLQTKESELTTEKSAHADLAARYAHLEPLTAQFQSRISTLEPLTAEIQQRDATILDLRAQLDAQTKQHQTARMALDTHVEDLENLGASLRQAQSKVQALENLLHQTEAKDEVIRALQARVLDLEPLAMQLTDRDARLKEVELRLQDTIREKDGMLESFRQRILFLEEELSRVTKNSQEEIAGHKTRVAALEPLAGQFAALAATHQELQDRHLWLVNEKDAAIQNLRRRVGELEPLGGALAERDTRLREVEHTLHRITEEREAEMRRLQVHISELESLDTALQERDAEIARMQNLLQQVREAPLPAATPAPVAQKTDTPDDLKLIYGVGPVLEKLLHKQKIFTFKEIALWTPGDILRVDALLEDFHGRIVRDGWVASAREEHFKKYGERL